MTKSNIKFKDVRTFAHPILHGSQNKYFPYLEGLVRLGKVNEEEADSLTGMLMSNSKEDRDLAATIIEAKIAERWREEVANV
jgi:hypothetical protein